MAPFTPQFLKSAQKRILVFCASFFLVFSLVLPLKTVDANALLSGYVISRPEFTLTDETLEKVFASVVADMPDWFSYYNYALYNLGTTTFGYNLKLVLYPRSSVSLVARCATNNCVPTWGSISLYETLSSSANTGYEYRFSSGGTFVSKITLNNAAGVFNTFAYGTAYSTMPYYTSFTDFAFYYSNKTPANFNGSAVDYGAKEIPAHLSHAAYNRVGLVPGPEIPREGLVSMFDWIYSRPGYGSALSQNYYLILPEYSSGIITGWTVYLFPINSGDDMANYFMMIDSDTNNYLESIKLRFDGRVRPAMRILFDTQFNYIQSSSAGSLEEFEFSKVPVSYTNMPAYFQYGFEYFEPSDETFAILNGRLLPADLFDDLLVPVSFNLGTGLSDDFVFNIFKAALEVYPEVLDSYYYTISGGGPGNESGYVLELYPKINASTVYKGYMNEAGIIYRLELDINGIASG